MARDITDEDRANGQDILDGMMINFSCYYCNRQQDEPHGEWLSRQDQSKEIMNVTCHRCYTKRKERTEAVEKACRAYKGWFGFIGRFFAGWKAYSKFDREWAWENARPRVVHRPAVPPVAPPDIPCVDSTHKHNQSCPPDSHTSAPDSSPSSSGGSNDL